MDPNSREDAAAGYERQDLNPRSIALFGAALAVVIGMAVALITLFQWLAARQYAGRQPPRPPVAAAREAAEPRLQVNGPAELRAMREAEERALNGYGWVDREAGIVRIPIDRAMEILAQKGLPARQEEKGKGQK